MTILTNRLIRAAAILAILLPSSAGIASAPADAAAKGKRCGWIHNPSPANWWLVDRDGQWEIGTQGGYQAPGMDKFPDLTESRWVVTNGASYGYGCACLTADVNPRTKRVTRIYAIRQQSLAVCRADRKLPRPSAG